MTAAWSVVPPWGVRILAMPSIRGSAAHTSSGGSSGSKVPETTTAVGETTRRVLAPADRSSTSPTDTPQASAVRSLSATGTTCTTWAWSAESRRVRVVVAGARRSAGDPAHPVERRVVDPHDQLGGGDVERLPVGPGDGEGVALRGDERSGEQRRHRAAPSRPAPRRRRAAKGARRSQRRGRTRPGRPGRRGS